MICKQLIKKFLCYFFEVFIAIFRVWVYYKVKAIIEMENQQIFYKLNNYIYNLTNYDIDPIEIYNYFLFDNNLVIENPELTMIILRQIESLLSLIKLNRQLFLELL